MRLPEWANRRAFFHALVLASLLGAHAGLVLHSPSLPSGWDDFWYIDQALSRFHDPQDAGPQPVEIVPLYPLWLNLLMHLDPAFADFLECASVQTGVRPRPGTARVYPEGVCEPTRTLGLYAHALLGAVGIGLAWCAGRLASGRIAVAHLAAFIVLLSGQYAGRYDAINTVWMTESLVVPLFAAVNVCLAWLVRGTSRHNAAIAATGGGIALGALILTRPPYEYLPAALLAAAAVLMLASPARRREAGLATARIVLGACLMVAPWIVGNHVVRGFSGLTETYASAYTSETLVQRLAYNGMTARQWMAAILAWTSPEGARLARRLFGREAVAPLRSRRPGTWWDRGRHAKSELRAAPPEERFSIVMARMWAELPKHLAVSVPIAWRGMIPDDRGINALQRFWPLLWLLAAVAIVRSDPRDRRVLLALLFCPAVVLAIGALVSVNLFRNNIGLMTFLSAGAALPVVQAFDGAWRRLGRRAAPGGPDRSTRSPGPS